MRRKVDVQWLRRTLARVRWLADRASTEQFAQVCADSGVSTEDVQYLGEVLHEVAEVMKRLKPEQPLPCAVCGGDLRDEKDRDPSHPSLGAIARLCGVTPTTIARGLGNPRAASRPRPDVRYCSAACRQRAYRTRVAAREQRDRARVTARQPGEQHTRNNTPTCDMSPHLSASEPSHAPTGGAYE